ncbi:spermidine/putrescine-binding protein [Bradyrhizobium sp. i1.3.1]
MIASALAVTGPGAVMLAPVKPALAADQVTITSYGGALQMSNRKAYFEPFAKATGIKVTEDEFNGEIAKVRAMVESKTVSWDVVDIAGERGCANVLRRHHRDDRLEQVGP